MLFTHAQSISTEQFLTSTGVRGMLDVIDYAAVYCVLPFIAVFLDHAIGREDNPPLKTVQGFFLDIVIQKSEKKSIVMQTFSRVKFFVIWKCRRRLCLKNWNISICLRPEFTFFVIFWLTNLGLMLLTSSIRFLSILTTLSSIELWWRRFDVVVRWKMP